jgi:3-oxoadipate enol-lactonase
MSTVKVNGVDLFYKESGSGAESIVFSHGLLMDHAMFDPQRAAFERHYRVIAYDHRAQGQSGDPGDGYDMDTLTQDAAGLIQALGVGPCHFVGLSMGGFVGMRLAARRPDLVRTLTLMNTGAGAEAALDRLRYGFLSQLVKVVGTSPFTGIAVKELFGRTTRTTNESEKRAMLNVWTTKLRNRQKNIAHSILAVMNRADFSADELAAIRCPTLVIAGEDDTAQPPRNQERLAAAITNARLVRIPSAGHSSTLEQPEAVSDAIRSLITGDERRPLAADRRG